MTCNLCNKYIELDQMRHSNGEGDYHIVCEYNAARQKQGMPPFETTRSRANRTISSGQPILGTRAREKINFNNKLTSIDRAQPVVIS